MRKEPKYTEAELHDVIAEMGNRSSKSAVDVIRECMGIVLWAVSVGEGYEVRECLALLKTKLEANMMLRAREVAAERERRS